MKPLNLKLQHLAWVLLVPFLILFQLNCAQPTSAEQGRQLLEQALAIDPNQDTSMRLLNLVNQARARMLLDHIDDLFFDPAETEETLP